MESQTRKPLVICFGDSLTVGYRGTDGLSVGSDVPYGGFLQKWMESRGRVVVSGLCGELTADMVKRFTRDVVNLKPDYTVILGGTNDLGWGIVPSVIVQNLTRMYHQAFEARIQPVGVTVPSIRPEEPLSAPGVSGISDGSLPEWVQSHISSRLLLNRLIEAACFAQKIPCVDLFSETAEGPHHFLAASFSSDGLHLSREGYERFAKIVWEQVFAAQFGGCGATQGKPRPS